MCDLTALSEDGKLWEHAAPADQYHFDLTGVPIRASTVLSVRGSVGFIADYSADAVYDGASISWTGIPAGWRYTTNINWRNKVFFSA